MGKWVLIALLSVVAVAGLTQVANAQYMYLDANANGVSDTGDRLNANLTPTTVDLYVRTNQNRDGSTAVCDTGTEPLTINQYQVNLLAVSGVVTYSGFINQQASMPTSFGEFNPDGIRYKNGFGGGTQLAAGLYRLCTITITGQTGTPRIDLVDLVLGSQDFTGFGTSCLGRGFDNVYRLDGPNVPPATGDVGDFVDWDGVAAAGLANNPPVVVNPGNRTVNELALLAFTVTATDLDVGQTLTFSLDAGAPAGANISPTTGAFSWTPTEAQGPGVYPVTIRATDNGTPPLSGTAAITITVNEVNSAPVVTNPGNRMAADLVNLAFTVTATDSDIPANTITWSLTLGTPPATGATIGAGTGAFSWTPTEAQGPGTYLVTIVATDNGTPALSGSAGITITVNEVNVAPVLAPIGNKTGTAGTPVTFTATATDADIPVNTLFFSLDPGAPAGATIGVATGDFSWMPSAGGTYPVTVRVTDNGSPALNDFEAISISVGAGANQPPVLGAIGNRATNELVALTFTATATDPNVGDVLTFSLDAGAPAGAAINGSTGAFSWTPTEAHGPGSFPITVRVTDNGTGLLSDTELITVTVNEVNVAPVVTNPGNRTVAELANLAFTVTATDADVPANTITWSLTLGTPAATGATIGAGTGAFSWTPTEAQGPGVYPVTITATDNGSPVLSGSAAITITVTDVNVAPVVTNPGNRTTAELANLAFTVTATDADVPANTITWSLTLGTPAATGATIGAGTGAFSWTPTEAQGPGVYPVTITATDNGSPVLSGSAAITITVTEVNVAPVVTNPGNGTVAELANLAFTVTATDGDLPAQTITWSLTLGTPAATGATIGAGTGAFSWTPTEAQGPGVYPVTITATDNGSPVLSGSAAITITVTEVNVAPVVTNPGNRTVAELVNLAFTVTATDSDVPANTIIWSLTLGTPAATGATIGAGTGAFSWTPTEVQGPGTYPVTITATDNGTPALGGSAAITISVTEVNVAPVLTAIGSKTGTVGVAVTFAATATDADVPANTLTFSLDAGAPAGATINGSTGAFSWTPSASGTFPVTVRVTDNGSPALNDFEAISITVGAAPNQAPVIGAIGNRTVAELAALTFTATATDPNAGDVVTFSLDAGAPAGATINGSTGAFSWTPTEAQGPGSFPITVRVTDNGSPTLSDFEAITVTVNEVNVVPVVTNPGNQTTAELANLAFTTTATDSDLPANTITWSLTLGTPAATGATIGAGTGAFSWTPTEAQGPGVYPVTITATDNGTPALSGSAGITITVTEVNVAPVVTNPGNRTTNELVNLAFTVTATDADVPANTITWSLTLGTPAATGATIGAGTGAFSWTPTEAQGSGVYPVTITATDNGTPALSGSAAITITVNEVNVAPVVTNPGNRTTAEIANLAFTVTATDADVPANTITWSLTLGTPAATGATIGAGTGAFSWAPTEAQGPGVYPVTITATDNGTPALSGSAAITITVTEVNVAPILAAIGNKSGTVSVAITFTATATDADLPANTLTFSLDAGAPAGATINGSTGAFSWTPSANGTFPVTVRVTDNGSPALNDFEAITITVSPAPNQAPVLGAIGNRTVNELATLAFTATATDADAGQTLTFSLDAGAPAGATINGSTGAFSWTPTEAQGPGSSPITVRVTDNGTGPLSDTELITVTVNEVNVAPVVTNPGNQAVNELANLAFTVTATDADVPGNTITWSLTLGTPAATGATIGAGTGAFSWTPTEAQGSGVYPVTITATDNGTPALSGSAAITITVNEVNVAPVVTNPGNRTTNELVNLAFTVTATDADVPANTITWSLTLGTPAATGATIGSGTGAFSWTSTEAQGSGVYPVTITATDNGTPILSGSAAITITVNEVNVAPVVTNPGNRTTAELANLAFTVTATDADLPANTITWSLTLGTPAATGATINGGGAFSWTPTEAQGPGVYPVTITATDNGTPALSGSAAITITVTEVNNAPVVTNPGNQAVNELASLAFTVTATDSDLPAQTITWSLTLGTPAATGATIGSGTGAFSWTPTEAQGPGVYPVTITATDNGTPALSGSAAITITVNEVNVAPVVTNPGNRTVAELVSLAFTVTATDGDLPAQTITWSLDAGAPAGVTINGGGAFSWTPTEAQGPGTYPVTIRATDDGPGALSGTAAITITVTEVNVAPVLAAIGNKTGTVGVPVTFTATATDADTPANTLTFSLDAGAPAGATIGGSTGAFSWTPSASGTFPVTVRVTDNGSPALNDFEAISITVGAAPNQAPVLGAIGSRTVAELAALTFTATATDPNAGDVLTFSLDAGAPAGAAINGSTGAFSWTPTEAQGPGSFPITVRVTDNGSPTLSDFEAITVTVNEVNSAAPVLAAIGNKTVDEQTLLTFTATATDADLPANALTFSLVGPPPGVAIVPPTGVLTWTPTEAQGPGVYNLTVVVTDDGTPALSDQETFSVTVFEVNAAPALAVIADKTVSEGSLLTFTATAADADIPANTLTFSLDAGAPAGATITAGGVFNWTPPTAGTFPVTVRVTDNGVPPLSDANSFTIIVQGVNHAPVLTQPADMSVNENATADQQLTATDPDAGDVFTFSKDSGPAFMTVSGAGNVHLAPGFSDAGVYPVSVMVSDNGTPSLSDTKSFEITVININGAPTADAGGPYNGSMGASIDFNGTASSDPDGDVLTYAWAFGDGETATGATPAHAYAAVGVYNVTLVVTDPRGLNDADAATATIISVIDAQIILENSSSTLDVTFTGNRSTLVGLEETVLPYTSLIPDSVRISHTSTPGVVTECPADTRFPFVSGDMDADGVPDLDILFENKCLDDLFHNIPDNSVATIVITGQFSTEGGMVPLHTERAVTIRVKPRGGTPILVIASPNPFNPETSISYTVRSDGPVTMKIYSIDGRLVRTLKQGEATVRGTHEVTWNGTDDHGRHASSGIYFVKTSQKAGGTEVASVLKLALTK